MNQKPLFALDFSNFKQNRIEIIEISLHKNFKNWKLLKNYKKEIIYDFPFHTSTSHWSFPRFMSALKSQLLCSTDVACECQWLDVFSDSNIIAPLWDKYD